MQKSDKERVVAELTERLRTSETLLVADYRGLSMTQIDTLRTRLLDHGARFTVVKNTLTRRAAEAAGADALLALLEGPTAIAFLDADGDPVAVAKALGDAARDTRALAVRGGILQGREITPADVENLARLPAAEVLQAQLVGALAGPLTTVVGLFAAPLRELVGVIDARIRQLGEQGAGAAPERASGSEPQGQPEEQGAGAEPEGASGSEPQGQPEEQGAGAEPEPASGSEPQGQPEEQGAGAEPEGASGSEPQGQPEEQGAGAEPEPASGSEPRSHAEEVPAGEAREASAAEPSAAEGETEATEEADTTTKEN